MNDTELERRPVHTKKRRKTAGRILRRILFLLGAAGLLGYGILSGGLLRILGYPDSLIQLMQRNAETVSYVLQYPLHKNEDKPIDVSAELTGGDIPLFLQWDARWGYRLYGQSLMGLAGCGPTSLSMVYCGLTGDSSMDPYAMACYADANGYHIEGSGTTWDFMDRGAAGLGLTVHDVAFDAASIGETLRSGMPIICIMGPGDFTTDGHFIVLTGIDAAGNVTIHDPNSKHNSERTWTLDTLMSQMLDLWAYSYTY